MRKRKQHSKPVNDLSRSLTPLDPNHTLIAVIEMSQQSWLVAGIVPGVERQPLKKLEPEASELLTLFDRWRMEAEKAGHKVKRIAVAFETGRDGFWLARWLRARGIEAPCHPRRQRGGVAGAPAGQDRPARYGAAETRVSRLAARGA